LFESPQELLVSARAKVEEKEEKQAVEHRGRFILAAG
jgi:hypothetical protein